MSKLKCTKHDRRVMVLDQFTIIHRSDGSHCDSDFGKPAQKAMSIGNQYVSITDVLMQNRPVKYDPAKQLLNEIFKV